MHSSANLEMPLGALPRRGDDATTRRDAAGCGARRICKEVVVVALTFDPFREMDRLTARLLTGDGVTRAASWMPNAPGPQTERSSAKAFVPGISTMPA